ncbi:MAG: hypothetical protein KKG60_03990 [Nanoarchaeota archaeon]|nr:hypothetical protein [Nanoarchaeota archaeon]
MKKAQFDLGKEWILWMFRISIVILVLIFLYFMVFFNISKKEDTGQLTLQMVQQKLLYSQECFVYSEENPSPGILDENKLTEENLKACISSQDYGIGINILKQGAQQEIINLEMNSDILKDKALCRYKKTMDCLKDGSYVLIREKDKIVPAYMNILLMRYNK